MYIGNIETFSFARGCLFIMEQSVAYSSGIIRVLANPRYFYFAQILS